MAKKKKSKRSGDARGYSGRSTSREQVAAGISKQKVHVSTKVHEGLKDLLVVSVESDNAGDQNVHSTIRPTDSLPSTQKYFDTSSKRFHSKVSNLHDNLIEYGFTEEHVQSVVHALGSLVTLEAALDWLCLNLSTQEIPPLFTEGIVRTEENQTSSQIGLLQQGEEGLIVKNKLVDQLPEYDASTQVEQLWSRDEVSNEKKKNEKEDSENCLKSWVLEQYQYESEEGDHDAASEINEEPSEKVNSSTIISEPQEDHILPEERQLKLLEDEIETQKASLDDDVANYMRSKHEIKELKKNLKMLESKAKGLRKKVAKLKSAVTTEQVNNEKQETLEQIESVNEDVSLFSMFDNEDNEEATSTNSKPGSTELTPLQQRVSDQQEGHRDENALACSPLDASLSVPKDWTGRTPKQILEERCRANKLPKPQYQRMSKTRNGCRVLVQGPTKPKRASFENEGPFDSFANAQEYLATQALYALYEDLPLYRLFPPAFRDLWRSWLDEKKAKKEAQVREKREQKYAKLKKMISSIPHASTSNTVDAPLSRPKDNTQEEKTSEFDSSQIVVDSWEDGFEDDDNDDVGSGNADMNAPSSIGIALRDEFKRRRETSDYKAMLRERVTLPMHSYRDELLNTIQKNQVTVLFAETGAGKTTQCPQFILEDALLSSIGDKVSIICTQPRRISAMTVADRVADEFCEPLGETVGYHIRMKIEKSHKTKLLFCTTGVVLRRLQDDPNLEGVTHVVVDEVHERQWQIDFLLIALRQLVNSTRPDLKVILMSATLDAKLFCSFFEGAPLVSVPGRTFPVANYYLEDLMDATDHIVEEGSRYAIRDYRRYERTQTLWVTTKGGEKRREIATLDSQTEPAEVWDTYAGYKMSTRRSMDRVDEQIINYDLIEDILHLLLVSPEENTALVPPTGMKNTAISEGAVLVFLPGLGEIKVLTSRLQGSRIFGNGGRFEIIPLHSTISPKEQKRAFVKSKAGCQKIILSTNIAETSVTIPDVVCVIDSGLLREVRQNKRTSTPTLVTDWCSRASSKQRSGRAGRVQPGICCKLFSSQTSQKVMKEQATPELQRVPLEEVCLSILSGKLASNCMDFLQQAPQPPTQDSVQMALDLLKEVGAIEPSFNGEFLTPLGYHLGKIPVHVRLGKMLIFGALFNCIDKIVTVAASLSSKSPFSSYFQVNATEASAKQRAFTHPNSDFLTLCNVWEKFAREAEQGESRARRFCDQNYLSYAALAEIRDTRRQFIDLLRQIGFLSGLDKDGNVSKADPLVGTTFCRNSTNETVVHAVICAGLYPNVAHSVKASPMELPALWHRKDRVYLHSSSVNHNQRNFPLEWIAFHEKFATSKTYVSATCCVHPFSLMLFGSAIEVKHLKRKVIVDDWIELNIAAQTGVMFRELRAKLDALLKAMIESIESIGDVERNETMIEGIVKLLSS